MTMSQIVLVHLGAHLPDYLQVHLTRLEEQFPGRVQLISDSNLSRGSRVNRIFPQDLLPDSDQLLHPGGLSTYPLRPNLWMSSFRRLALIGAYASVSAGPVLHLESDVVVLWPEALDALARESAHIRFPLLSDQVGIASTLVLPNADRAKEYLAALRGLSAMPSIGTEMEVLGSLAARVAAFRALDVVTVDDPGEGSRAMLARFDGAAIGVHFLGVDPVHTKGVVRVRTGITRDPLDMSHGMWRIAPASYERPELEFYWDAVRIATLHGNSKEPRLFRPDGKALRHRLETSLEGRQPMNAVSVRALGELADLKIRGVGKAIRAALPRRSGQPS